MSEIAAGPDPERRRQAAVPAVAVEASSAAKGPDPKVDWRHLTSVERGVVRALANAPWVLIAALAAALWLPLKLLRVARGDTGTALALAELSDKANVVAGSALLLLPSALLLTWTAAFMVLAVSAGRIAAATGGRSHVSAEQAHRALLHAIAAGAAIGALGWVIVAVLAATVVVFAALANAALSFAVGWSQRRAPKESELPDALDGHPVRLGLALAGLAGACMLLLVQVVMHGPLDDKMWLPPRSLTTADGSITGYVLDRDDDRVTFLRDNPRQIVQLDSADLDGDRLCALEASGDPRPLWDRLRGKRTSPLTPCP